ncbi:MAG: hypothetical protein BGP06_17880 [Rhizobiales bacterium 65-9]|nr:GntR family transcriptional regulator [Hyphomicrobiales bacterium]OJY34716.1 MAG: hypothetical protein BGP06_17880 [Rhizobiales bacterium 65-9]
MAARQDKAGTGRSESLAARARRLLEERIVTLKLAPGSWVTEQELSAQIGLGRTPVREALQRLIGDGLVVVYPRRGLLIPDINPVDVFQALDTRVALEQLQARDAALRAKSEERKELLRYADKMRAFARNGDTDAAARAYMEMDRECDALLSEASGNPFTAKALEPLQTISRRAWWRFCREADLAPAADLHAALLDAAADGRADDAASGAQRLVDHVRAAIRDGVRRGV